MAKGYWQVAAGSFGRDYSDRFTRLGMAFVGGDAQIATMEQVRRAVGPNVDIAIDCLGRLSPVAAVQMADALEEYGIFFCEEPILPENIAALAEVAHRITIPVATGERLYFRSGFQELFESAAAQVIQPDLCHCGGCGKGKRSRPSRRRMGSSSRRTSRTAWCRP